MMNNAKIGVALVGGYLLGRTKKAKMAIGLGMFLAGRKLNLDPRQLGSMVANSPVLGPLNDQVRKELVEATKSAAGAALTQRMSGLADSLHERTLALDEGGTTDGAGRGRDDRDTESEDEPRGDAKEPDDDAADPKGADDAESEKPAPRRRTAAKSSSKTSSDSSAKSGKKSAPAKKSAGADRSAKARRPASSASGTSGKAAATTSRGRTSTAPGRKAASGARHKASGAARAAADRGGRNA
ncbi:hypothetical protein AB0C95_08980 [Streptomyces caniferus]|uniref:hypothetical protein n=1 Tax=Streptomyces caniferus TaxID=285557 RepID=UPI0033CA4701